MTDNTFCYIHIADIDMKLNPFEENFDFELGHEEFVLEDDDIESDENEFVVNGKWNDFDIGNDNKL